MRLHELQSIATRIRRDLIGATTAAGSGHLTSSLSAVELMTGLMFGGVFRADLRQPDYPNNDRLIFSKGHAAPLLYALYGEAKAFPRAKLGLLRRFGSPLEGHPMPRFRYTEAPTGSLGQGLSIGVGEALAARMTRLPYRTYVLLGDSEMAEGQVWEAIQHASHERLDQLVGIIDGNGLGQSGPTMLGRNLAALVRRVAAFGWETILVDGHDLTAVTGAYRRALQVRGRPTMIVAKTVKGKGIPSLEGRNGWHGRVLSPVEAKRALTALAKTTATTGIVAAPSRRRPTWPMRRSAASVRFPLGSSVAPRQAIGQALVRLAPAFPRLVVLDAEVKNSTATEMFADKYPKRFVEAFIAEQHLTGMANGLAARGLLPVSATFAAFWTRAFDQLRMNQYARTHQVYVGTHAGVHIGQDGASQMGLQDIAMFRTLERATVLYPSDATSAAALLTNALRADGLVYLRATRGALPVIYPAGKRFPIGGSVVWHQPGRELATIVAAGVTLHEALRAAARLRERGRSVRVIDLYSIAPIDALALRAAARQTKHLIVVEDHRPAGGIAEAVRSALGPLSGCVVSLAVTKTPRSGTPEQLLSYEGIDADAIVAAVMKVVRR